MYCRILRRTYIPLCHYSIIKEIKVGCAVKRGKSVEVLIREGGKRVDGMREWEVVL